MNAPILSERADGLSLRAGNPPVVHLHADPHTIEGPAITPENAESLLRSLADTRQVRQLRETGGLEFVAVLRRGLQPGAVCGLVPRGAAFLLLFLTLHH